MRSELGWAIVRVTFGLSLAFFHGYRKVFEGGVEGLTRTVAGLGMPFPGFFAWAAALSEFFGGLLLAVGLATRPAGALIAMTMCVALYRHRLDPFARSELALLFLSVAIAAMLIGSGRYGLDRTLKLRLPIGRKGE